MTRIDTASSGWRTVRFVLIAGCLISMIGFGIRSSFGLWLDPMTEANGWSRETFALAMAIQNLLWGAGGPIAGALAESAPSKITDNLRVGVAAGVAVALTHFALV